MAEARTAQRTEQDRVQDEPGRGDVPGPDRPMLSVDPHALIEAVDEK